MVWVGCGGWFGVGVAVFFGLEAAEILEGVAVIAVRPVDTALEAREEVGVFTEGLGDFDLLAGHHGESGALLPELGFADTEAAEEPFSVDEGIDEHALLGCGGVEAVVIFGFEGFEVGGFFAADDLGFGVDAGFQGIHGGAGLAL